MRTTTSWVSSFGYVAELTGLTADSRIWLPGPVSATMTLFAATLARHLGAVVTADPAEATHAHLTPHQLARALGDGVPLEGRHLTVAGAPLGSVLRDRAAGVGAVVSHYYGAAELSFVAWGTHSADLRPFPGVQVQVREGEIWVRSRYLCQGYAGTTSGALRTTADGWATVGDRGSLAGGCLTVAGRGTDAVTTGGSTVLVADVEEALRPVVTGEVVVVPVAHSVLGQVVGAVLTDGSDAAGARARAQDVLAPVQWPRLWFEVDPLPLTDAGKVDRTALASLVAEGGARRLVPGRGRP